MNILVVEDEALITDFLRGAVEAGMRSTRPPAARTRWRPFAATPPTS